MGAAAAAEAIGQIIDVAILEIPLLNKDCANRFIPNVDFLFDWLRYTTPRNKDAGLRI